MRHIAISIILVMSFLNSFGQTQQMLKNGFVAATDDGVYYLQDGFNEWVRLGSIIMYDTVNTLSYYKKHLLISSQTNTGSGQQIFSGLYGNKIIYGGFASSGSKNYIKNNATNKLKYNNATFGMYSNLSNSYWTFESNNVSFGDNKPSDIQYCTSISSDNDSIVCFVGKQNRLVQIPISQHLIPYTLSSYVIANNLHSRPTDSHQICYNPDDDVFIIVSDSGIVYSYDKATLTTIDTLSFPLAVHDIKDIEYLNGFYFIIAGLSTGKSQYFYKYNTSTKILTYIFNITNSLGNLAINPVNNYVLWNYGSSFSLYDFNGNIVKSFPILIGKQIFDLDYINYLP
jgi:hypothetical protein